MFLQGLLRVFTGLGFIVGPVIGGGLYSVCFKERLLFKVGVGEEFTPIQSF